MPLSLNIPGGTVQLSGNPIWCNVTGAVIPEGATNYLVLLKVTSLDGVLKGGPFIDGVAPDSEGAILLDISGYVNQPVMVMFEWPMIAAIHAYIDAAYNIAIVFGESYTNSAGQKVVTYDETPQNIQIIKGGIPDWQLGLYNENGTNFFKEIIEKGKFLTSQPNNMKVAPNQPVKLSMVSPYLENTQMVLYVTGHYEDGTSESFSETFEIFRDGIFEFNVAPWHVGIPMVNVSGSKMAYFGCAVVNPVDGQFGDSRTYYFEPQKHYENNNFLIVANSFGVVDVLWLNGEVETSIETTGTEGHRPMAIDATSKFATILATSRTGRKSWKINTGYKSKAEIEAMTTCLLSQNIWLIVDGKLIPVIVKTGNKVLVTTMEDLYSLELEFTEAHYTRYA